MGSQEDESIQSVDFFSTPHPYTTFAMASKDQPSIILCEIIALKEIVSL